MQKYFNKIISDNEADNEIIKGSVIALSLKVVGLILGYCFTLFTAKYFGAKVLGNFILAFLIVNMGVIISLYGIDTSIVAFFSKNNEGKINELSFLKLSYFFIVTVGLLLTILFYVTAPIWGVFSPDGQELFVNFLRILSLLIIPMSLSKINSQYLRSKKKIFFFSYFGFINFYLVALIILFSMIFFNRGVEILPFSYVSAAVLTFLLSAYYLKKILTNQKASVRPTLGLKNILTFSRPIFFSDVLLFINTWLATFMVGYFLSSSETGVFGLTYKLAAVSSIIISSTNIINMPKLGEHFGNSDWKKLGQTFTFSSKLMFWASLIVNGLIVLCAPFVLSFIGEKFIEGYIPLIILLFAQQFESWVGSISALLPMINKQRVLFILMLLKTILLFTAGIIFIPFFGMIGGSLTVFLSSAIYMIGIKIYVGKRLHLKFAPLPFISDHN